MLPATISLLREHGFADGDRADRVALADRCRELLLAKPVDSADQEEIQAKALIVPELRYTILGDPGDEEVEQELDLLINPLVGANGLVQKGLENGYVLCAAQVTRKLGQNGEAPITIRRRGRFVSEHPDAIEQFFWTPALVRLSAAMGTVKGNLELGARRQPALQARTREAIAQAHADLEEKLPLQIAQVKS